MKRAHGYRSNFELDIANQLAKSKVPFLYEKSTFEYTRHSKYTPDFYLIYSVFLLPNHTYNYDILVESVMDNV